MSLLFFLRVDWTKVLLFQRKLGDLWIDLLSSELKFCDKKVWLKLPGAGEVFQKTKSITCTEVLSKLFSIHKKSLWREEDWRLWKTSMKTRVLIPDISFAYLEIHIGHLTRAFEKLFLWSLNKGNKGSDNNLNLSFGNFLMNRQKKAKAVNEQKSSL